MRPEIQRSLGSTPVLRRSMAAPVPASHSWAMTEPSTRISSPLPARLAQDCVAPSGRVNSAAESNCL